MKIRILLFLLLVSACDDKQIIGDEPAVFSYFFQLRDISENAEFFLANPSYKYQSLTLKNAVGDVIYSFDFSSNNNPIPEIDPNHVVDLKGFFEDSKVIAVPTKYTELYLDYGNGDIDTLTQTSIPSKGGGFIPENPDTVFYNFNGKLVLTYPYKTNYKEIASKNDPRVFIDEYETELFKPIIFTIDKIAEK